MEHEKTRKTDRRTLYTRHSIKEAFLRLKRSKTYNAITISDICKAAQISRSTFYLHYGNTHEVLDEVLNDAVSNIRDLMEHLSDAEISRKPGCPYPLCKYVRESRDCRCIFFDDSLTGQIIDKLSEIYKERFIERMQAGTKLTSLQLEALFYFQVSGCFSVSKRFHDLSEEIWCPLQLGIDQFVKSGFAGISEHIPAFRAGTDKQSIIVLE